MERLMDWRPPTFLLLLTLLWVFPGRHHYGIIWRMRHIMGKLPDDIAAACKSLVVLCDLS
ncbi:hypothetical protein PO909_003284 [Leuciscus waleckii]